MRGLSSLANYTQAAVMKSHGGMDPQGGGYAMRAAFSRVWPLIIVSIVFYNDGVLQSPGSSHSTK
jgi:hypothetical protein